MDETPVNVIRESHRNLLLLNRRKQRDEESDVRRSIADLGISSENVEDIAKKLKTKSSISVTELVTLKNALLDDVKNIEIVLNIHGALRGLVREITGHDVNKQYAAAGCCCNLALGDSRAGAAISKAAGPYLIAALDSLNTELAVTCAWTLGNLAGSGTKACELLSAQGLIGKLVDLLRTTNEDLQEAIVYALTHVAYVLKNDLSEEHLNNTLESVTQMNLTASSLQLLFILTCHDDFETGNIISEQFILKLLEALPGSIEEAKSHPKNPEMTCKLLYLIRILANMYNESMYKLVLSYLVQNNMVDNLRSLLSINNVKESLLWLLGNMYKLCSDDILFIEILS